MRRKRGMKFFLLVHQGNGSVCPLPKPGRSFSHYLILLELGIMDDGSLHPTRQTFEDVGWVPSTTGLGNEAFRRPRDSIGYLDTLLAACWNKVTFFPPFWSGLVARSVILRIRAYCGMVCPLHSNSLGFFGKFGANGKIRHLGQYHCVHMAFGHEG